MFQQSGHLAGFDRCGSGVAKRAANMDVVRAAPRSRLTANRFLIGGAVALAVLLTVGLARLRPAAPPVDRGSLVIDTVKRGPLVREVRGSGVLTPENIRWITALTDARVERIAVQPGTAVTADTIIIELADVQQQQSARDAEWQLRAAQADYDALRAQLESQRLDVESSVAQLRSAYEQARLRAEADRELQRQGLAANITQKLSETTADELSRRLRIEEERLKVSASSQQAQLAAKRAAVEQRKAMLELQQERTRSLHVRAGIDGVLQQIAVQAGQSIAAGTAIARVAQTDRLKAEIRIPDTQAKDVRLGQLAKIDTRNGIVDAQVSRIDPAVTNGGVAVDLRIDGPLPAGARPDLNIDAIIQLEKLNDTTYAGRPVNAQENSTATMFRLSRDGSTATRVRVDLGRASATSIEIRRGLAPGDQVIVSDTSAFDQYETITLK
jgi:HlyD family secretion protein